MLRNVAVREKFTLNFFVYYFSTAVGDVKKS